MVLKCEIGICGRKPQVEEYVLDALTASVEQVVRELGQLAGMLAVLAVELAGPDPVVMRWMRWSGCTRGRELLRAVLQYRPGRARRC